MSLQMAGQMAPVPQQVAQAPQAPQGSGLPRQLAAIIDDGCRRARLADVRVPTLVLHGEADPLVKLEAGEDTARHISGARLVTSPGWGHDIPLPLVPRVAGEIVAHARGQ